MKTIEIDINVDEIALKLNQSTPALLATEILELIGMYMEKKYPNVYATGQVNDNFDDPIS